MASESHGLFQFDDYDAYQSKTAKDFEIDRSYTPRTLSSAWFLDSESVNSDTQASNNSRYKIDYLYWKKQYFDCLDSCKRHLELFENSKSKNSEVVEIALRCCTKLEQPATGLKLMDRIQFIEAKDPGLLFIKGSIYFMNNLYAEALKQFIDYVEIRPGDSKAWIEFAKIFVAFIPSSQEFGEIARSSYLIAIGLSISDPLEGGDLRYQNSDIETLSVLTIPYKQYNHRNANLEVSLFNGLPFGHVEIILGWIASYGDNLESRC